MRRARLDLAADTRIVNGQTMGSMLLALPDTPAEAEKAIAYIRSYPGLTYEEVKHERVLCIG